MSQDQTTGNRARREKETAGSGDPHGPPRPPSGFRLHTSNRLEVLAEVLARVLARPLSSPLAQETIVVQSNGMARWLSLQLAERHGICANCAFPFPNAFISGIFRRILPGIPDVSPFDPGSLTWRIMKRLPDLMGKAAYAAIDNYLENDLGGLKRFQLSERIADLFDQYLLFRPDMIFRWESGRETGWQADLFRDLEKETGKDHRAALGRRLLEALRTSRPAPGTLPERVSIFGISALPRFHMEIFSAISAYTEVNLFLMNPCREYWGDILSRHEIRRTFQKAAEKDAVSPGMLYLDRGNPLLASMGTLGRDFFDLVSEFPLEETARFEDPGEETLLSMIQSDILDLRDPQADAEKRMLRPGDASIQIHSCHGPMREMEVLHDRLLDMFEKDPALRPADVLVMAPDIELYAPYIQAVFDAPGKDETRIPFSVADRNIRSRSGIAAAFLSILDLRKTRFGASRVLAILDTGAVRRRYGLSAQDMDTVTRWVTETRIRWGMDGASRRRRGLPGFHENTWRAGLDRLFLGYALPGGEERMLKGILPYDHIEGADVRVLGRFAEFLDQLLTRVSGLDRPRPPDRWADTLREMLEAFFPEENETENERQAIRSILNDLSRIIDPDVAGFDRDVHIEVIRYHLGRRLEKEGLGTGFLGGGITFCAMLPMRSIPFKVICLVGMNHSAYPRQSRPPDFDLIAAHPRSGDRSRRDDDRYLFLEALLSARDTLYISHVGRDIRDNSPVPPSVLVSELTDYIEEAFRTPDGPILDHVTTTHRLQGFSPAYFSGEGDLFSYREEHLLAARAMVRERKPPKPFLDAGLPEPAGEGWRTLSLDDLCAFFKNPARYLLRKRLGILLREAPPVTEDREVFEMAGLDRFQVEARLMAGVLRGRAPEDLFPPAMASGRLPHGTVGKCVFDEMSRGVEDFSLRVRAHAGGRPLEALDVDLSIGGFRLTGQLRDIRSERWVLYRYARIRPADRLGTWIRHLCLNMIRPAGYPGTTLLAGLEGKKDDRAWAAWEYPPVEEAGEILHDLLDVYWRGLRMPLHFFPEASWAYVRAVSQGKGTEDALGRARNTWLGSAFSRGESEDPSYDLCFREIDPVDEEFMEISNRVFTPLLARQREPGEQDDQEE